MPVQCAGKRCHRCLAKLKNSTARELVALRACTDSMTVHMYIHVLFEHVLVRRQRWQLRLLQPLGISSKYGYMRVPYYKDIRHLGKYVNLT